MKQETKHTPWIVASNGVDIFEANQDFEPIATTITKTDAAQIVREHNSHDALIDLIKDAILAAGQGENVKHMLVDGLAAAGMKVQS